MDVDDSKFNGVSGEIGEDGADFEDTEVSSSCILRSTMTHALRTVVCGSSGRTKMGIVITSRGPMGSIGAGAV